MNEGFKDRRRRLSSSSDEDFMRLSDDQETYKSDEEKKPEKSEVKKKPSNFQYQKPRRGKGRGNNNWRREDKPRPKQNEKPQPHYRKKATPKYDIGAEEFHPAGFNANASDFVSFSQVPTGFNPSAQEFNPHFGVDAPEFKPSWA